MNTLETILAILSGWLAAAFGWIKWWYGIREKRRERTAKERAEAQLNEARNRADAAFFLASSARANDFPSGHNSTWFTSNGNVLSVFTEEVHPNVPAGTSIVLPLANEGEDIKGVSFQKDGVPIRHVRYTDGDRNLWGILEYPFDPDARGKIEIVEVRFESRNGFHRVHRYAMEHGRRRFFRVEPRLPFADGVASS
jgi:hypothetical protein